MEPSSEKVFEDDKFVHLGLWHGLCAGGSTISLGEIASIGLHQPNAGFHDTRWPKVIADPIQGSRRHNFQAPRVVRGSFTVSRVARPTLRIRISTAR
jgi:hypothetical protein